LDFSIEARNADRMRENLRQLDLADSSSKRNAL
jgi:predicted unusual protein kinase regulating ubiquinone biosynthesis (AarF/ABC1/UbiB family)